MVKRSPPQLWGDFWEVVKKMKAIYIPQLLKASEKTETIEIEEFIPGLETLTPVRGTLIVTHGGNYLEISTQAETIVTMICDRCLQHYNYRLPLDTSEIIWLEENDEVEDALPGIEREVSLEDLSEKLPTWGYFEPDSWLYEQLCLAMPLRKLCGKDCRGATATQDESQPLIDSRWATLAALKEKLSH